MRGRDQIEKAGEVQELFRNFGNFPGSEVLTSTIVYVLFYLYTVSGSSFQVLWPTCNVITVFLNTLPKPISSPSKGSKQDQKDITTCTWPPCPELL